MILFSILLAIYNNSNGANLKDDGDKSIKKTTVRVNSPIENSFPSPVNATQSIVTRLSIFFFTSVDLCTTKVRYFQTLGHQMFISWVPSLSQIAVIMLMGSFPAHSRPTELPVSTLHSHFALLVLSVFDDDLGRSKAYASGNRRGCKKRCSLIPALMKICYFVRKKCRKSWSGSGGCNAWKNGQYNDFTILRPSIAGLFFATPHPLQAKNGCLRCLFEQFPFPTNVCMLLEGGKRIVSRKQLALSDETPVKTENAHSCMLPHYYLMQLFAY